MLSGRALGIAAAVFAVLWLALDSNLVSSEPPVPGTTVAIGVLGVVFGFGGYLMHAAGRTERVPLLIGTALGIGAYVAMQALAV